MALTTGCDGAECFFLKRIGLDSSEFSDSKGTGNPNARVRIYKSQYDQGQTFPQVSGSAESAFDLWNTPGEMLKYDIVFDACECSAPDRGGAGTTNTGYINFLGYLNAGGRAFTTHYFYNSFADNTQCDVPFDTTVTCYGQNPLPTVGDWYGNQHLADSPSNCPNESTLPEGGWPNACLTIDTNIPKGKAFADWYQGNNGKLTVGGSEAYGYVGLTDIRQDIGKLDTTLLDAGTATPWLFAGNVSKKYDAYYLTVNTPVGTTPASQCGRAVFSDVHVEAAETTSGAFPSYCPSDPNANDHAPNQLALEFLFFDLSSCVQNDTQPPPPIN